MAPARPRPVSRLRLKSESSEEVEDSLLIRASRLLMLALDTHTRIRFRIILVLRIRDIYPIRIPDMGSRIPDPGSTSKEEGENIGCLTFLCSHNFHKIVNYFIFEKLSQLKKNSSIFHQGCGSVFIFSGSGSRVWCWRPIRIRIRIQYGSRALMTKNGKNITAEFFFFLIKKCNLPIARPP
jgi:hypothetical protein